MLAVFVLPGSCSLAQPGSARLGLGLPGNAAQWREAKRLTNSLLRERESNETGDKGGGQERKGESNKEAGLKEIKARNEEGGGKGEGD